MPHHCQVLCRSLGLVVLATMTAASRTPAQDPAPAERRPGTTLYLVLRTGPKEDEQRILATLKTGLKNSGSTTSADPTVRPVSPAFFEEFATLVDRAAGQPVVESGDGVGIRLLPSREPVYEVRLKPTQILKQLRITDAKGETKEYTPKPPTSGESVPLMMTVPGRYAFAPDPGSTPTTYEAVVHEIGQPEATLKGSWPVADKFFVVTMRDFQGDRGRMFEVIQDSNQVANPLDNVQLGNDLVFAFAALNSSEGKVDDLFPGTNTIALRAPALRNRSPKRAWAYFPLNEEESKEAVAKFRKIGPTELPAEIRKAAVQVGSEASLSESDPPRWFELPPNTTTGKPDQFSRPVTTDGFGWMYKKYPKLYMLQVWEFDAGQPEAIMVESPSGDRVPVLEFEFPLWESRSKAAQKSPSPDAKTPAPKIPAPKIPVKK